MGAQDIIAAIKGGLLQSDRLLKLDTPPPQVSLESRRRIRSVFRASR
jgi:hypothetical protein